MTDLTAVGFWHRPEAFAEVARLRRDSPVHRHPTGQYGDIWSVLSHAEAVEVLTSSAFTSRDGSLLSSAPGVLPAGAGKMMAMSDPPAHRSLRGPAVPFFSTSATEALAARITTLTEEVVDRAVARTTVDFVRDVAAVVPMTVVCDLLGLPPADRSDVVYRCETAFAGRTVHDRRAAHQWLLSYLFDLAARRKAEPGDDLVSALLCAEIGGRRFGLDEVVLTCDNIIVGGVQSVRHAAAVAFEAVVGRPALWSRFTRPDTALGPAVEELLRWTSAALHVLRTANRDVRIAGRTIPAGDRVVVWLPAANRDEAVFDRPEQIDLSRHPNPHLALGWGPHYCIGAALARLELRSLFEQLRERVAEVDLLSPPVPQPSIIIHGFASMPVRLHPTRARGGDG